MAQTGFLKLGVLLLMVAGFVAGQLAPRLLPAVTRSAQAPTAESAGEESVAANSQPEDVTTAAPAVEQPRFPGRPVPSIAVAPVDRSGPGALGPGAGGAVAGGTTSNSTSVVYNFAKLADTIYDYEDFKNKLTRFQRENGVLAVV